MKLSKPLNFNFQSSYKLTANAAIKVVYNKFIINMAVMAMSVIAILILSLFALLMSVGEANASSFTIAFFAALLLFGHKFFNKAILKWRLKSFEPEITTVNFTINNDGVFWENGFNKQGSLEWQEIHKVIITKQQVIFCGSSLRFCWLPRNCFADAAANFIEELKNNDIKVIKRR